MPLLPHHTHRVEQEEIQNVPNQHAPHLRHRRARLQLHSRDRSHPLLPSSNRVRHRPSLRQLLSWPSVPVPVGRRRDAVLVLCTHEHHVQNHRAEHPRCGPAGKGEEVLPRRSLLPTPERDNTRHCRRLRAEEVGVPDHRRQAGRPGVLGRRSLLAVRPHVLLGLHRRLLGNVPLLLHPKDAPEDDVQDETEPNERRYGEQPRAHGSEHVA